MNSINLLATRLKSVAVFRNLLKDDVINTLQNLLDSDDADVSVKVDRYASFVHELYTHTENLSRYILTIVTNDENVFIRKVANGQIISDEMNECVRAELAVFEEISINSMTLSAMTVFCLPGRQKKLTLKKNISVVVLISASTVTASMQNIICSMSRTV